MSDTLYIYAEHFTDQAWQLIGKREVNPWYFPEETPETQQYEPSAIYTTDNTILHSMLVGRRNFGWLNLNQQAFEVLAPARGLPLDLSPELREWVTDQQVMQPSWLWLDEVLTYDWTGKLITRQAMVKPEVAHLFGDGTHPFPMDTWPKDTPYYYAERIPDGVTVTWRQSYAASGGAKLLAALEPLKVFECPHAVRLVFWFT